MLLSSGRRLVLCNAVLNKLATYFICSFLLPCGVLEAIDKRRRSFFWTGKDSCSGARCLMAWEKVCLSKQVGGFGMRDLQRQNLVLLMNFVHKLHQRERLPWKDWFQRSYNRDLGDVSASPSYLEKILHHCLDTYRSITTCDVRDGRHTSFWLDRWVDGVQLSTRFPAIFSHCLRPNLSVAAACSGGLSFRPRLSAVAEAELPVVLAIIAGTSLVDAEDCRSMAWGVRAPFSSRAAYAATAPVGTQDGSAITSWGMRAPAKIRIFCLLADCDRLNTRSNLHFKNCAPSPLCASCGEIETTRHLLFDCATAADTWSRLGCDTASSRSIWDIPSPTGTRDGAWELCSAAILWQLWKARNDRVFNAVSTSSSEILRRAADDIVLWSHRVPISCRPYVEALRGLIIHC